MHTEYIVYNILLCNYYKVNVEHKHRDTITQYEILSRKFIYHALKPHFSTYIVTRNKNRMSLCSLTLKKFFSFNK